jgi:hypothetical protein
MGFISSCFAGTEGFRFLSCPSQGLEVNRTLSIVQHSQKRLLLLLDGGWWTMDDGRWKCHHHDWIAHVSDFMFLLDVDEAIARNSQSVVPWKSQLLKVMNTNCERDTSLTEGESMGGQTLHRYDRRKKNKRR